MLLCIMLSRRVSHKFFFFNFISWPPCMAYGLLVPCVCVCVCVCVCAKWLQSCPTLYDPMDHSLLSSSVHGILQARILELGAVLPSRDLPNPGISLCLFHLLPWQASSLPLVPPGKPLSSLTREQTCAPRLESMES